MATAADKRQIEALKALARRWSGDAVQLRFVVVVALFLVGLFGLVRPLSARLESARAANKEARTQARLAEDLRHFHAQSQEYSPRLALTDDLVDWQTYVLEKLRCTSATLISLEPRSSEQRAPFVILDMEVVARGTEVTEFADFASRLEHGERCIRIVKLRFERQQGSMYVTMVLRGIVRAAPEEKADKDGDKDGKAKAGGKTALAKEKPPKGKPTDKGVEAPPTPATDAPAETPPTAQAALDASAQAALEPAPEPVAPAPEGAGDD